MPLNGLVMLHKDAAKTAETFAQVVLGVVALLAIGWAALGFQWGDARIGLVVAVLTLGAVGLQIAIANRQLAQADLQLGLAREELDAVREDLTYSREVSTQQNRRASLRVISFCTTLAGDIPSRTAAQQLVLNVYNIGERTSRAFRVNLGFPGGYTINFGEPPFWQQLYDKEVLNWEVSDYTFYASDFETIIYPGDSVQLPLLTLDFGVRNREFMTYNSKPILWRVAHEDAMQPHEPLTYYYMSIDEEDDDIPTIDVALP